LLPAKSFCPLPLALTAETNNRTANESAFAPRRPGPPKTDEPKPRKPPSKFGISDRPDPMPELEKPDPPNGEFPKSEPPKPETPKPDPPKFPIELREEEKDENRVDARQFSAKRLGLNPKPAECKFDAVARPAPNGENPEALRTKEALFLAFPNERH
jgi:hypothetical protein